MKLALSTLGACLLLAGCATGPKADEHAAHHPPDAAAAAPAAPAAGQMDSMMKSMHDADDDGPRGHAVTSGQVNPDASPAFEWRRESSPALSCTAPA